MLNETLGNEFEEVKLFFNDSDGSVKSSAFPRMAVYRFKIMNTNSQFAHTSPADYG
jgi:hypothetical protein